MADTQLGYRVLVNAANLSDTQLEHGDVAPLVGGMPTPDQALTPGDVQVIQHQALGLLDFQARVRELRSILPEFSGLSAWLMRGGLAAKCGWSKVFSRNER